MRNFRNTSDDKLLLMNLSRSTKHLFKDALTTKASYFAMVNRIAVLNYNLGRPISAKQMDVLIKFWGKYAVPYLGHLQGLVTKEELKNI